MGNLNKLIIINKDGEIYLTNESLFSSNQQIQVMMLPEQLSNTIEAKFYLTNKYLYVND